MRIITGVAYERIKQEGELKKIHILVNGEKKMIEAEQLLISSGRTPNTEFFAGTLAVKFGLTAALTFDKDVSKLSCCAE